MIKAEQGSTLEPTPEIFLRRKSSLKYICFILNNKLLTILSMESLTIVQTTVHIYNNIITMSKSVITCDIGLEFDPVQHCDYSMN